MEAATRDAVRPGSLAERYARLAHEANLEPRPVDAALRGLDVAIAGGTLVVSSPVIAAIAAAIRLTSGSPVLYRGRRVGRAGPVRWRGLASVSRSRAGW